MLRKVSRMIRADYKNFFKVTLSKENYKRIMEMCKTNKDCEYFIAMYHKLGRDKKKFNKAVSMLMSENHDDEILKTIDGAIEKHKEAIKHLEKLKKGMILRRVESL